MKWFKSKTEKLRDKIELQELKEQWELVKPRKNKGEKAKTVIEYNEKEYRQYLRNRLYKGGD